MGNEPATFNGEGESYGFELFAQQKLTKRFFGLISFTYYYSKYRNIDGKWLPGAFDSRYMLSTTLGYKFPRNWELGIKMRFQGGAPYTPFDLAQSQTAYFSTGKGVLDAHKFNSLRLASFSSGDIRITKRWNFKKFTLDLYADASNFWLAQSIAYPQYSFKRNLQTGQFKTNDGNALKADGSNALPIILNDTKGVLLPTIGFIIEL